MMERDPSPQPRERVFQETQAALASKLPFLSSLGPQPLCSEERGGSCHSPVHGQHLGLGARPWKVSEGEEERGEDLFDFKEGGP